MPKALFIHDGPLGIYNDEVYGIHYKNELIDRYAYFGDSVTFLMRQKELIAAELSNYSLINHSSFNFISIPNFKSLKTLHNKPSANQIIKEAVRQHDVIIVRLPSAAGVLAFKEAKKLNKPVLVEFVACVYDALWNYDWRGKLLANYKFKQYQKLMLKATHTIYVTNEFLQSRYPTRGKSIGCSDVELQDLDPSILKERIAALKNKKTPIKLGTVAALDVIYKGQADMIKAIAKLKEDGISIQYEIIGQGNPERLQNLIDELKVNDLVEIVGPLPHSQIFDYLINIDIYIQPSKQEGLPRAVIEAMSVGCPVIGTDVGGIPELISKEFIYPKGNIGALANKLINLSIEDLILQSEENFEKAKEYQKEFLDKKRINFYKEFLND
jgi:glycosyltransferase involved in cell wall biosynthesis